MFVNLCTISTASVKENFSNNFSNCFSVIMLIIFDPLLSLPAISTTNSPLRYLISFDKSFNTLLSLGLGFQDQGNCQHYARDFLQNFCSITYKTQSEQINQVLSIAAITTGVISVANIIANSYINNLTTVVENSSSDDDSNKNPE